MNMGILNASDSQASCTLFECVPAPGGPRVKQPRRMKVKESRHSEQKPHVPYVFPPELQRPGPRRTIRKPGTLGVSLILGRVLWVAIAAFGVYTVARVPIYALLAYRGEVIDGQVQHTGVARTRRRVWNEMHYSFEYRGRRYTDSREIDSTQFAALGKGQTIPVLVRAFGGATYNVVLFPGERKFNIVFEPFMEALGWNFLLPLGVGFVVWIRFWWEKRLCRLGTVVRGQIVRKEVQRGKGGPTYYLYYEFQHPRLGLKTSPFWVSRSRYEQVRKGESVTIICNP